MIASAGKEWVQTANALAQQGRRAADCAERSRGSEEPWLKPRGVFSILQTCESVGKVSLKHVSLWGKGFLVPGPPTRTR